MVVGDFNLEPVAMQESLFPRRARLSMVVHNKPTCVTRHSQSVIDYGMMTEGLAAVVADVQVNKTADIKTHRPVVFTFLPRPVGASLLQLKVPKVLHKAFPFGPLRDTT